MKQRELLNTTPLPHSSSGISSGSPSGSPSGSKNYASHITKGRHIQLLTVTLISITVLSLSSVALSGCTPSGEAPNGTSLPAETQPTESTASNPPSELSLPSEALPPDALPSSVPESEEVVIDSSQLPTAVETTILEDITSNYNVPAEDLEVETAVAKSWPDGCLGLGGPDEICTFALVEGWEVTVSQGDNIWMYRTDMDGFVVREDTTGN
ncbi:MAG: hypothetical protein AB8B99_16220 [Phormidesmis sp.]